MIGFQIFKVMIGLAHKNQQTNANTKILGSCLDQLFLYQENKYGWSASNVQPTVDLQTDLPLTSAFSDNINFPILSTNFALTFFLFKIIKKHFLEQAAVAWAYKLKKNF